MPLAVDASAFAASASSCPSIDCGPRSSHANASEIELLRGSETLYRFYDPSTGVSAPFDDMLAAAAKLG